MTSDEARRERGTHVTLNASPLPNLIIIGAQKCGTTSLHNYLQSHPDVSMARVKETDFFLEHGNWAHGLDWYRSQFDSTTPVRGEGSPNYTNLPRSAGTADRMHSVLPDARLIYLVRDPVARITSHYVHLRAAGVERRSFGAALSAPDNEYIGRSRYATQLEPFLRLFGPDRILVETHANLLHERRATLSRVFEFIEVDQSFESPEFERIWETTQGKGRAYSMAFRVASRMKSRAGWLPQSVRWPVQRLLRSHLAGRPIARTAYTEKDLELVREALSPEVEHLRALTGLALEGWLE